MTSDKLKNYPKTKQFECVDIISTPHPYCITPSHIKDANTYLDKESILRTEKRLGRPCCGVRGCNLWYSEHEIVILIEVDDTRKLDNIPELHPYLLSIKEQAEKDGFAGFAFKQK